MVANDWMDRLNTGREAWSQMSGEEFSRVNLSDLKSVRDVFSERLRENVPLARFTAARVGGPADFLLEVRSADELAQACDLLWEGGQPFVVLGGGSNVLVSDDGIRGLAIINRAKEIRFDETAHPPAVWAESGSGFGVVARKAASLGFSGLEWAAGIPGSVGGAVVGNAGAHGGDMAGNLLVADILHRDRGREQWDVDYLDYQYRSSVLKPTGVTVPEESIVRTIAPEVVVLGGLLKLRRSDPRSVQAKIDEYVAHRRRTQPPGASMGSMFKNPPGDYAGRLIEGAGLKGTQIGDARISTLHANFFINLGHATAADIYGLIMLAHRTVAEMYDINLELEIELIGEWKFDTG